uniref:Bm1363, isoform d n=1 Tax=Brugia malayi TaxID=6279 RepID=A0A1I9G2S5_BRUMA|nr:Bm1363, isoform d [Brugia malayi]
MTQNRTFYDMLDGIYVKMHPTEPCSNICCVIMKLVRTNEVELEQASCDQTARVRLSQLVYTIFTSDVARVSAKNTTQQTPEQKVSSSRFGYFSIHYIFVCLRIHLKMTSESKKKEEIISRLGAEGN